MIDADFLRFWSPVRIAVVGALGYLAWVIVAPLNYDFDLLNWSAVGFAFCAAVGFLTGCMVVTQFMSSPEKKSREISPVQIVMAIWVSIFLGTIGVLARAYDRFVVRGQAVTGSFSDIRESLDSSLSVFGYIGGGLFSFGMIALMLHWLLPKGYHSRITLVLAIALAAYPVAESMLQGSRSTTFQTVLLLGFCARATGRLSFLTRSWFTLALTAGALGFAGLAIYEIRALENEYYSDPVTILLLNALSDYAPPSESIVSMVVGSGSSWTSALLRSWIHFSQYFTSTWLIYSNSFSNFSGEHGWGALHLSLPMRVVGAITGSQSTYSPFDNGMLEGVWGTAFGWLWYDFGWIAPIVTFFAGVSASLIHRAALVRPALWLPLYSLVAVACAFVMVDNQLIGGIGAFTTWTFLLYVMIAPAVWAFHDSTRWATE